MQTNVVSKDLPSYQEALAQEVFAELASLDESLSTRTFGVLGFAVVITGGLAAAASSGRIGVWWFVAALIPLALGVGCAASSLFQAGSKLRWEVAIGELKELAEREAGRTGGRARLIALALGALLLASVATTAAAIHALQFKTNVVPVDCQVAMPAHVSPSTKSGSGIVSCTAPVR